MRKYIILFFSVFPFLFACNSSGVPDNVIPKDQMTALLTEVHLADGNLVNLSQVPDTLYKYGTARFLAIFKKFHTDSAQFRASYKYYSTQPQEFQDIYDKVLSNLQAKNDSLNKLIKKENMAHLKKPSMPTITTANKYGVGIGPQVPATNREIAKHGMFVNPIIRRKAIRDSIAKAHLKNRHAISR